MDRIRSSDLTELRDEWLKDRAPATVVRRMAFLSHVYTVIRKDWGFDQLANPVQVVRRPAIDDARDRRLFDRITLRGLSEEQCPRQELDWIIQATRSSELPTILTVAGNRHAPLGSGGHPARAPGPDAWRGPPAPPRTAARDVPLTRSRAGATPLGHRQADARSHLRDARARSRAPSSARRRARLRYEALCRHHGRRPNTAYFRDLRFHDLRHEGTSQLATVFQIHELAKVNGNVDTRMLLRYYHPHGRELAQKLARSPLGKRQLEQLRRERLEGLDALPLAA